MHVHIDDVQAVEIAPGVVERVLLKADKSKPGGLAAKHYILTNGGQVVFDDPLTEYQHYIIQGVAARGGPNGDLVHSDTAIFVPCPDRFPEKGKTPVAKHIFAHAGEGELRILTLSYKLPRPNFRWAKGRTKNLFQVPQYHSSRQMVGYTQLFSEEEHAVMGALRMHAVDLQTNPPGYSLPEHRNPEEIVYVLRGEGEALSGKETHKVRPGSLVYTPEGEVHSVRNTHESLPLQYICIEFIDHEKMWAERAGRD